jgi:hypothetical protein
MPNRVFASLSTLIRAFDAVIDGIPYQVQKCLAQPVDDPPIKLRVAGHHLDFDLFPERIGELACMSGQRFQKGRQGLNLEVEERVELAFSETAQNALPTLELHRHLPQRGRKGCQNLLWSAFADPSLREGREPKNAICEAFRSHRHNPESCAAVGEIVHQSRRNTNLLPPLSSHAGTRLSGSRSVFARP